MASATGSLPTFVRVVVLFAGLKMETAPCEVATAYAFLVLVLRAIARVALSRDVDGSVD